MKQAPSTELLYINKIILMNFTAAAIVKQQKTNVVHHN